MVRIAVEEPLQDIQQALQQKGYQADLVDHLEETDTYDIAVVRSLEEYKDLPTKASLVGAAGLSTDEIVEEVEGRMDLEQ